MLEALAGLHVQRGSGRPPAAAPAEAERAWGSPAAGARDPIRAHARRPEHPRRILAAARVLALIAAFGLASCDTFLDTGAHTQRSAAMSVAFVVQSGLGGDAQAFDKADAARIVLTRRSDGSTAYDETIDLSPAGGDIRTTIDLDLKRETEAFDLTVELLAGGQALFEGATTVTLRVDETASVELSLDPVIASILIQPESITMTALGDSIVLDVVALFATEDTARSVHPTLTTLDAGIATVSGTTVKAVGEGTTSVVAQSGSTTTTVPVQVQATVASVSVSPESDTILVGDELQLTAGAHDANGHALVRTAAWSSSDPKVVTVDATGRVHALAVGRATVTAAVEGVHGQAVITVDPVPIPDVTLTVSVHGLGSVTSSGVEPAIACYADTCSETYPLGTQLTLTANDENPDFLWESWYGTGSGFTCTTSRTCVVTMDQDRTVTAWFSAPGIVSIDPDTAGFSMAEGGAPMPSSRAITVSNIGERSVGISTATSYGQDVTPWLSTALDRTVVDTLSPATLTLSVMKNGLGPGTYTASVYVGSSFTGGTVHVTLRVLAPSPVISNVTAKLEQLNDSIICGYQTPHGSLFRFSFTYADPDGDVNQSTAVLTVDYRFSSGTSGQFEQPPEPGLFVGGDGYDGTVTSYICNVFGASTSVTETFTLQDAAGHASNSLSITVPRPEGAHIPPLGKAETQSNYSKKPKAEGARVTGG